MDCKLVSVFNAGFHLTGQYYEQSSEAYKNFICECGCQHGACINLTPPMAFLGIQEDRCLKQERLSDLLKPDCFIEVSVWEKHYGFHAVDIIDYNADRDIVRVTNFKYQTDDEGWITTDKFKEFIRDCKTINTPLTTYSLAV